MWSELWIVLLKSAEWNSIGALLQLADDSSISVRFCHTMSLAAMVNESVFPDFSGTSPSGAQLGTMLKNAQRNIIFNWRTLWFWW